MYDNSLALMTGVDMPIPELQIIVHQPTIKEISMIGEPDFFTGIQMLCIKKENYIEDEQMLQQTNNFQLFISMINEVQFRDKKQIVMQVLMLLLPDYTVQFTPRSMLLKKDAEMIILDEGNFEFFQKVLIQQFCLSGSGQESFNPANEKAREIARKLTKARQKVAQLKAAEESGSMFGKFISILTVGLNSMRLEDCLKLTMYQLYDLIERYNLYIHWDIDIRSRLTFGGGGSDKPIEDWMKNIHN